MISTYGNDLHLYAGNWRCNGCSASENHKMWFYTSQNGSANWNVAKMVLDAGGNLGLGTTSPRYRLNVENADPTTGVATNPLLTLTNQQYAVNTGATLGFEFAAGTLGAAITGLSAQSNGGGSLLFATRDNGGAMDNRLFINGDGKIGIGASPSGNFKFEVAGLGTAGTGAKIGTAMIGRSGGDYDSVGYNFRPTSTPGNYLYDTNDYASRLEFASGGFRFKTAPVGSPGSPVTYSEPMTILQGGNVGIGTTTPSARLEIGGGSGYDLILNAGNTGSLLWGNGAQAALSWDSGKGIIYGLTGNTLNLGANGSYNHLVINTAGNVEIGNPVTGDYKLNVNGNTNVAGNITATGSIAAKYQDVAEWVPSSEQLSAGTVVVLDSTKSNQVTSSSVSYDTRVAGVISEQPGIALGEKSEGKVLVATTGRVRVKVDASKGAIHVGDLLVTSDIPGIAMKSEPVEFAGRKMHMPGTLIGKALEPLEKGKGEILVLLSLQ
jgi:hypothetical protein